MRVFLSGLCLSLALGAAAFAQDASPMLSKLHDDLRLTADQEAAWSQYQAVIEQGAQAQARHQSAQQMMPQLRTPRRLALLDATMSQDLADFHRQSLATLAFYDRLTPAQQGVFDRDTMAAGQSR